jgi:plasmid maintenance system killer protein
MSETTVLYSLNRQFRLILRLETDEQGKLVCIISIEDYH